MNCAHCLRGESENKDMPPEVMKKALKLFDNIRSITFTGGEPSLNVPLIELTLQELKQRNKYLESFFIATNGKENVDELLAACDKLYFYCKQCTEIDHVTPENIRYVIKDLFPHNEEDLCALALSVDQYHEPPSMENIIKLISRSYFSDAKIQEFSKKYPVIRSGRALMLASDMTRGRIITSFATYDEETFETIYINVDGEVIGDCDTDYANQAYQSCGNVMDNDIEEMLHELLTQP